MDDLSTAYEWAKTYQFDEVELHCCTLLALQIFDEECNMDYDNHTLFISVYDGIAERTHTPFDKKIHQIIELSRTDDPLKPKKEYGEIIHNLQVAMMENMDKSSMKEFNQLVWNNQN